MHNSSFIWLINHIVYTTIILMGDIYMYIYIYIVLYVKGAYRMGSVDTLNVDTIIIIIIIIIIILY